MDVIQQFISENLIYALGWTVMHSLWQGFLIAILMAIILQVFRKKSARLRYEVATFSLFLVFISAVCTFIWYLDTASTASDHHLVNMVVPESLAATAANTGLLQGITQSCIDYFNQHLPLIVLLWLVGVAFFILRLMGGLVYVQRLKHHRVTPLPLYWNKKVQAIAAKIPTKRAVGILESASVKVPMVIGYFKPIILLPIGAINQLDEKEIEAVIAHELAHVFRNDFLLNIILSFIEVFFYYHPAVWWISGNIRLERENCCDDIAIRVSGNSLDYAKALVRLQELNVYVPSFAMPFSGQRNQLLNRIKRILNQPQNRSNILERLTATCFLLIAVLFMSVSANNSRYESLQDPTQDDEVEVEIENVYSEYAVDELVELEVIMDSVPEERKVLEGEVLKLKQIKGNVIEAELDGEVISREELDTYNSFELDGRIIVEQVEEEETDWPRVRFPRVTGVPKSAIRSTNKDGNTIIFLEDVRRADPFEIVVDEEEALVVIDGIALENGDTAMIKDRYAYRFNGPVRFYNNDVTIISDSLAIDLKRNLQGQKLEWQRKMEKDKLIELKARENLAFYNLRSDTMPERSAKIYRQYRDLRDFQNSKGLKESAEVAELRKKELAILERYIANQQNETMARKERMEVMEKQQRRGREEIVRGYERLYRLEDKEAKLMESFQLPTEKIISELKRDGLIDDANNFSFSLSESKLKINKKKQPKVLQKKYLKLYQQLTNKDLKGKSKFQMSTSSSE